MQARISPALGHLKSAKPNAPRATLIEILKGIEEAKLSYCCSVWGSRETTKLDKLQTLQNRAARLLTKGEFDSAATSLIR